MDRCAFPLLCLFRRAAVALSWPKGGNRDNPRLPVWSGRRTNHLSPDIRSRAGGCGPCSARAMIHQPCRWPASHGGFSSCSSGPAWRSGEPTGPRCRPGPAFLVELSLPLPKELSSCRCVFRPPENSYHTTTPFRFRKVLEMVYNSLYSYLL